jgi:hypothetical protein
VSGWIRRRRQGTRIDLDPASAKDRRRSHHVCRGPLSGKRNGGPAPPGRCGPARLQQRRSPSPDQAAGSRAPSAAGVNLCQVDGLGNGAGGTRTHDLRFRKPSLYPAELQPLPSKYEGRWVPGKHWPSRTATGQEACGPWARHLTPPVGSAPSQGRQQGDVSFSSHRLSFTLKGLLR